MAEGANKPIAILAEDTVLVAEALRNILVQKEYEVRSAESCAAAMKEIKALPEGITPALLVTDFGLKGFDTGVDLIKQARSLYPAIPVVMITGAPNDAMDAMSQEGVDQETLEILAKPFVPNQLTTAIQSAEAKAATISTTHRDRLGGGGKTERGGVL